MVSSLVLHQLPEDLRLPALQEMRRVLRPGGALLVAEAQTPRHSPGLQVLGRLHGYDRIARMLPDLELLPARVGFGQIRTGEVPPWLRYVHAVRPAHYLTLPGWSNTPGPPSTSFPGERARPR